MIGLTRGAPAVVILFTTFATILNAQDVLVTEFMARRSVVVIDDDGRPSDFVELFNAGVTPADLGGFFLSDDCDDPLKWTFPVGVVIEPAGFLVIWASEKDRRNACCDLHTNFRLDATGECLVLSDPFGDPLHIHPFYPEQVLGYSYGLAMSESVEELERDVRHYFPTPTPGLANVTGAPALSPPPVLSEPSGAYPPGLAIDLWVEERVEGTEIRLTLDGSIPTESSPLHTDLIGVDSEVVITARAFQPGLLPSEAVVGHYVVLGQDVLDFSSSIPLVICSTVAGDIPMRCGHGSYTPGRFLIFDPGDDGRAALTDEILLAHHVGFRRRGNPDFSCGRPKFFFNVEFRDAEDKDQDVAFFDFASHSDFAMWGPWEFDRTYMRNPIAFWMSREIGRWSPRTQFVETFVHIPEEPHELTMESYKGVYVLMERNERGVGRIDVERLDPGDNEEPDVTGGYILKRDRIEHDDVGLAPGVAGHDNIVVSYPRVPTDAQKAYISNYLNRMFASLGPFIGNQENSDLIDVTSFIDHHIINWFMKNTDAFRLSGYFYKTRGGLLEMGGLWDFDRSSGCAIDPRPVDPTGYLCEPIWDGGTRYFEYPGPSAPRDGGVIGSWYGRLFGNREPTGDRPWERAYRARWLELRQGPLSNENIGGQIDAWLEVLEEPAERNIEHFGVSRPRFEDYRGEVEHLKDWLATRAAWIDEEFVHVEPPVFDHPGGRVDAGLEVGITVESGTVIYTLNGPDPRGEDDQPVAQAVTYRGPIIIQGNARIRARARVGRAWSALVEVGFTTGELTLVVSELMYNPRHIAGNTFGKSIYEFLELHNPGSQSLDLRGVVLDEPFFEFVAESPVTTLDPGAYLVLVRDFEAFSERYDATGISIAGEYEGSLSNTSQNILITGPAGDALMDFDYRDSWEPSTDGAGRSLVIKSPTAPPESWNDAASWRASLDNEGSPGRPDSDIVQGARVQGDLNGSATLEISDAILLVLHLFGQRIVKPCETDDGNDTLQDVDGDAVLTVNDPLYLLNYLFLEGPPPERGLDCRLISGCPQACG